MEACFDLMDKYQAEAGFNMEPRYSALLTAESLERDALRAMCEQAIIELGLGYSYDDVICTGMDNVRKLQNLVLNVCVTYCKENDIKIESYV